MVTLCDLGVHINFIVGKKNIDMRTMAESVAELESKELTPISFKEYENIQLEFTSTDKNDRLYYDGIDLLPDEKCQTDFKGNLYLMPLLDGEKYTIFKHSPDYYAMRKGRFAIRLMHDQKIYYQCFEVCPQNVNDDEWAIMQKELEEEIQGFTYNRS